jgi:predicted HAD superfamily Cof-like phosphohydrolase
MKTQWPQDIKKMHEFYGLKKHVDELNEQKLYELLKFRISFIEEELNELKNNVENPEEIVDALIDICVVAIGTLDLYDVNSQKAWDEVLNANYKKFLGVKKTRPNPIIPDLIKLNDWQPPDHKDNHGKFSKLKNLSTLNK